MTSIIGGMATRTQPTNHAVDDKPAAADSGGRMDTRPSDFLARLERAAESVDDHRDALRSAIELRDELVVQAHDTHAMTTSEIAKAVGISQPRVVEILGAH